MTHTSPTAFAHTVNAPAWARVADTILGALHPQARTAPSLKTLMAQMRQPDPEDDSATPRPGPVVPALDRTAARDDANHPAHEKAAVRADLISRTLPAAEASDLLAWMALEADEQDAAPLGYAPSSDPVATPDTAPLDGVDPDGAEGPAPAPRPAADLLSPAQIATAIAEGDDPYAMDAIAATYEAPYPHEPAELLAVAQLAQALGDRDRANALMARNAATVLLCASAEELKRLDPVVRGGHLYCGADAAARLWAMRRIVVTPDAAPGTGRIRDLAAAAAKLASPAPLVILLTRTDDLTGALAHLPVVTLARINADAVVWTLRRTHSATGLIAEDAVRAALPPDAQLARMTDDLVALAFRADNPLRVARKLAALATVRVAACPVDHAGPGPRLKDLPGLGAARDPLLGLGRDLAAHAAGTLPWAEVTSGLILAGPPGTGKTTVAAALARSAGVPLIATSYSAWHRAGRFNEMMAAMAEAFAEARAAAPSILFIDEIDSLGSRSAPHDHNSSYGRAVINGLLEQIDGVAGRAGVLIVGATNHPEQLDPALVRPGRFGRTIRIAAPRERDLPQVFRYHLGRDLPGVDLRLLARAAAGMSQAEVMGAVQAARTTARAAGRPLGEADLAAAVGERHPAVPDTLRRRIAVHEAGHAVVAHLGGHERVLSATLSGGGGHVDLRTLPHANDTRAVTATLMSHLAGRAAEEVLLGSVSGGAGGSDTSDLARATRLAITEALSLGRGDDLSWHPVEEPPAVLFARHNGLKDRVVARLTGAYAGAMALIRDNRTAVEAIAGHLTVDGHLDAADLRDLLLFCRTPPRPDDNDGDGDPTGDIFGPKP